MKIFITGVNGFIGNWLTRALLTSPQNYQVIGVDIRDHNLSDPKDSILNHPRFSFTKLDLLDPETEPTLETFIKEADCVIPLAAIANPFFYVNDPLAVFELDFEHNLKIIKLCAKHHKRIIFPSTSEVYGMSEDGQFDEDTTKLVLGPVHKMRWIYSSSKQLLDRVICAKGIHKGLKYTLFRPFNWMGPRLDNILSKNEGESRAITQFMSNAIHGRPISLVNGGAQRRSFIYVEDAISALLKIIENKNDVATNTIFNIGNPTNDFSIYEIAQMVLEETKKFPETVQNAKKSFIQIIKANEYFGDSYEDVTKRVPSIEKAQNLLNWTPTYSLLEGIQRTLSFYLEEPVQEAPASTALAG